MYIAKLFIKKKEILTPRLDFDNLDYDILEIKYRNDKEFINFFAKNKNYLFSWVYIPFTENFRFENLVYINEKYKLFSKFIPKKKYKFHNSYYYKIKQFIDKIQECDYYTIKPKQKYNTQEWFNYTSNINILNKFIYGIVPKYIIFDNNGLINFIHYLIDQVNKPYRLHSPRSGYLWLENDIINNDYSTPDDKEELKYILHKIIMEHGNKINDEKYLNYINMIM